jgi:hypothetical protein
MEVSWPRANARRLQRHWLLRAAQPGTDPMQIAARICGAHAQVLSAAELSIALRIDGAARATVRRSLWEEHRLIKTHGPRGTVHLLAAEDLRYGQLRFLRSRPIPPFQTTYVYQ